MIRFGDQHLARESAPVTMSFFKNWLLGRRTRRLEHLKIILYSKSRCHLCHQAEELFRKAQQQYFFSLEVVDVANDAELLARFGHEVPVVAIDGKVRFRGPISPVLVKRLFDGEKRKSGS